MGFDSNGGNGGSAVGAIYNSGTLSIFGASIVTNNVGAGGGGGGGGGASKHAGIGGLGVGAIWNGAGGSVRITASAFAAMTGNDGASGLSGVTFNGSAVTAPTAAQDNIYNDAGNPAGNVNTSYVAPPPSGPSATIAVADPALSAGETSLVTITFSEPVTGFDNADLSLAGAGTLSAVASGDGGVTWTATVTPSENFSNTANLITLDNTGVVNGGGTAGVGSSNSNSFAVDTIRPDATIVVADNALRLGETSLVTITFTEAVAGFANDDLSVANGTLGAVGSVDGGVTWTATFTPTPGITDTSNLINLNKAGVADAAGNLGTGSASSNNYAIDTGRPSAFIVVADSVLAAGETSLVTFTFSEVVTDFTNSDLTIDNGTLSAVSSQDGGKTWSATFTPAAGIRDVTNLIRLSGNSVADLAGNTNFSATASNNYLIDGIRPTATIAVADNALLAGETSLVTFTFSEAVTGFANDDLTVANGTLGSVGTVNGGVTWTATFTPTADTTDAANLITLNNTGVADTAGNTGTGTTASNNYAIDTARPTVAIVVADGVLSAGETSLVTITFSEAVSGFDNTDLTVANGTLGAVGSLDGGKTWTATFTPTAATTDTSNVITLANAGVLDGSGNANSGSTDSNNYAVVTAGPTATIVVADNSLTVGESTLVAFTFSEAVTGFDNADIGVANGTLGAVSSADGGVTWTTTFTPTAGIANPANLITVDNTGVSGGGGSPGAGTTSSNSFAIDTTRPDATIVVADSALTVGETTLVTITFNEAVTGFANDDLTVANGTLGALSSADGGVTWTATFTPTAGIADTSNLITLNKAGLSDAAGNLGSGSASSNNYTIDTARPTVAIVVADSVLSAGETSLVTFTFSEAVSGFTNADLTVANGTLGAVSSLDGGVTWTATFTPTAATTDTTNVITLANAGVLDAAGNANSGSTDSNNYAVVTAGPTATIVVADNSLTVGESTLVTFTFSEAVAGFTNADISVANGTLGAVASADGGVTWSATFTPTAGVDSPANLITVDNTGVFGGGGSPGAGSTSSNSFAIDTTRPDATIVVADGALTVGETSLVTIAFTEAVTGFSNDDLTVANGTLDALSSADGGVTWTATFTPTAGIADTNNLITLNKAGVSDAAGNAGSGSANSNNYTIDTARPSVVIALADSALSVGETTLVTFTFSEAVAGVTNADLSIANGTLSAVSPLDGGVTWSATFTPSANTTDATNLITLNNAGVADLAGNAGTGTTNSNNYAIDNMRPSATIVVADNALVAGESSLVTITFSEAVTGFSNDDLTVANGTLGAVGTLDGGVTWTATFTPTADTTDASNLITLANTGVLDATGNAGSGTTDSNNYVIDTARPTAAIVVADSVLS
ncbi:Ig-like domain-containing protein, partial [Massilia glaciei]|uniref:beta strand repeat-containing protein n=1 Tax=Massilia glaciei TaxID=1524097 RepID=UPI001E45119A